MPRRSVGDAEAPGEGAEAVVVALADGPQPPVVSVPADLGPTRACRGVADRMRADMRRYAEQARPAAADWRPRWREDAVAFFERLPRWSIERTA
ncbi:hypothetical protein [Streptomyces sp. NPDC048392]|uniref:hypothetical protein n=1 Tax=Streptomyces sp. NPDC048392 TaxID=3365543 RepID=UPI0037227C7F